jgi:hypothetical protein
VGILLTDAELNRDFLYLVVVACESAAFLCNHKGGYTSIYQVDELQEVVAIIEGCKNNLQKLF